MIRCRWVDSRRAEGFPVTVACAAAGVSTTTFYDWTAGGVRGPSAHDLAEAHLVNAIIDINPPGQGGLT